MKVFCPNCGTENDGMPGGRLTCKACTASFEVPREGGVSPQPQVVAPPKKVMTAPQPSSSSPFPTGYVGPPPAGFGGGGSGLSGSGTNPLAIASMVLGIACCIPFASIGAVVTGVIAQNQITASGGAQRGKEFALVGIILGSLGVLIAVLGIIVNLLGGLR